jgi:hypothetical protein
MRLKWDDVAGLDEGARIMFQGPFGDFSLRPPLWCVEDATWISRGIWRSR